MNARRSPQGSKRNRHCHIAITETIQQNPCREETGEERITTVQRIVEVSLVPLNVLYYVIIIICEFIMQNYHQKLFQRIMRFILIIIGCNVILMLLC